MLKKPSIKFAVIIIISTIIYSCTSGISFSENVKLPDYGWYKDNAVLYNVSITDSISTFDFGIDVRNSVDYRYSNLYIFLYTEFPNGNISKDTIEFILADNEGRWLGKGWGELKENNIILKKNLRFPLVGDYRFRIQQAMRVDTLRYIQDVGLTLVKN
jgi:gliding motility-associated lipoprotein GldH